MKIKNRSAEILAWPSARRYNTEITRYIILKVSERETGTVQEKNKNLTVDYAIVRGHFLYMFHVKFRPI